MSITRRIAFGAAASWFSRGLTISLGLVLMPVLFRHLPKEELGVWLLLGQSWATMGILDLGISVTLTRRIALAKGKSGADPDAPLTPETRNEIADLVESGRRIYQVLAAAVFLIWSIGGFFYLRHLPLHEVSHTTAWIAWLIICACQALNVWAAVWTCLLQGVGYVGWDALIASFVGAAMLSTQITVVLLGGHMVALAVITTIGALTQRWLTRWLARTRRPELFSLRGKWNPEVLRGIPKLAFRAWLTAVGVILVQNTDSFFIASFRGAAQIPAFRAAFLVVLNLHMLAGVFAASSSVFVSHLWQAGQVHEVQRIVQRNLRLALSIMLCGGAAILVAGESLFNVWLGPSNYVGPVILTLFVVTFVFEQQTFVIATSTRATEDEAFAEIMMVGGVLKLLIAALLTASFGLVGLAAATLVAQSTTTYWFVVYRGYRRLGLTLRNYAKSILIPCLFIFLSAYGLSSVVLRIANSYPDWVKLGGTSAGASVVLVAAIWLVVLDHGQRARLSALISTPSRIRTVK